MKTLIFALTFATTCSIMHAQGTNSINVPNTGANTTSPPLNSYTPATPPPSVPANSTVPGANGGYTVDPAQPDINNPNTKWPNSTTPGGTPIYTTAPVVPQKENQK